MNRSRLYRLLGWLAPILCMAAAAFVFWRQDGALKEAEVKRDAAIGRVRLASAGKLAVEREGEDHHYAAANKDGNEQNEFLNLLRLKVFSTGATIVSWTANASTYGSQGGPSPVDDADKDLVKGITRINCLLSLKGSYPSLRKFVGEITASRRLFALSGISWTRSGDGLTSLQLTLSRYEAPNQLVGPSDLSRNKL